MRLVGLGYKARHGKDTVAKHLLQLSPKRVKVYGFADALKAYCRVMGWMEAKDGKVLQDIGSLMRRKDPLVWIKALHYRIEEDKPDIAVISDVRHLNEVGWISGCDGNGLLCKVSRYDVRKSPEQSVVYKLPYQDPSRPPDHLSEVELNTFDNWDMKCEAESGDIKKLEDFAREILGRCQV